MAEEKQTREAEALIEEGYRQQVAGRYKTAIGYYRKSIQCRPTARGHTFLAFAYGALGEIDRAIEECRRAIRIDPHYGNPYNDMGVYLTRKGCYEEAVRYLRKALRVRRYDGHHVTHLNLGRVLEKTGLWAPALREYTRALECEPNLGEAREAYLRLLGLMS